jgi:hypothetical protein
MFKALGVVLAAYVTLAVFRGEVYAKSGMWGRTIKRVDSASYFWTVIGIYCALALALVTVF